MLGIVCCRMSLDKIQRSTKELNTLMAAYHECMSVVVRRAIEDEDISLIEDLLDKHVSVMVVWLHT